MNKNYSKKQLRQFGLVIGIGLPVFIGFILPLLFDHSLRIWTIWVGIPFMIFGIFKPNYLSYSYKVWMALGHYLGWINSRIILGIIFFTVLLPISLILKIFGYDPLKRKKDSNILSYRENKKDHKINLERIF